MKRIYQILFVSAILFSCSKGVEENKKTQPDCMNEPPSFGIVIVKNEIPRNRYFDGIENAKKEAVLYKLSGNEKVKIENISVHNDNIYIFRGGKEVKTFFTSNLETFYVEYKGKTDTLQIKGIYHDSTGCGDWAGLSELHFNGKQVELNMIEHKVYKIDNTIPKDK